MNAMRFRRVDKHIAKETKHKLSRPAHQKTQNVAQAPQVVRGHSECPSQAVLCDALSHLFRCVSRRCCTAIFVSGLIPLRCSLDYSSSGKRARIC